MQFACFSFHACMPVNLLGTRRNYPECTLNKTCYLLNPSKVTALSSVNRSVNGSGTTPAIEGSRKNVVLSYGMSCHVMICSLTFRRCAAGIVSRELNVSYLGGRSCASFLLSRLSLFALLPLPLFPLFVHLSKHPMGNANAPGVDLCQCRRAREGEGGGG